VRCTFLFQVPEYTTHVEYCYTFVEVAFLLHKLK
jgi:hypothetical protein